MTGLQSKSVGVLLVAVLMACPAIALSGGDRPETPALKDAREEFEAAKRKYQRALEVEVKRSMQQKDEEALIAYRSELESLLVGYDVNSLVGPWRVDYQNGATRTYIFQPNGTVRFAEEDKASRYVVRNGMVMLDFGDGPVETLTFEPSLKVLHFNPKANLAKGRPNFTGTGVKLVK